MRTAGVILAAGRSRRMGQAKALLPVDGRTMLARMVDTMRVACGEIVVVLGHERERLRASVPAGVAIAENPEYDRGMLSSLQSGLQLVSEADLVLFTPVDLPALCPNTVRRVADAWSPGVEVVKPRCGPHRGHPVACGPAAAQALREAALTVNARDILTRFAAATVLVDVEDRGIYEDVDDPAAYEAFLKAVAL